MKVVYFNYVHDYKESSVGSWTHVNQFTHAFKKLGHRISIYSLNLKPDKKQRNATQMKNAPFRKIAKKYGRDIKNVSKNFLYVVREWKALQSEKPDCVIIRHDPYVISSILVSAYFRIPVILELNAPGAFQIRQYERDFFHFPFLFETLEKIALRFASAVTVTSREMIAYLHGSSLDKAKIHVNPMGVEYEHFQNNEYSLNNELQKLNGKIVLGFIGSLNYWHGINNLFMIMKSVLKKYSQVGFLIIGKGPMYTDLLEFVKKNNFSQSVLIAGYVPYDSLPPYIDKMDIALAPYPSDIEFYFSPLKIFEYLAAGKPILAPPIGQIADILNGRDVGYLTNFEDEEDWMWKLDRLISSEKLRNEFGLCGRRLAKNYEWRKNAALVEEICFKLIKNHQSSQRN